MTDGMKLLLVSGSTRSASTNGAVLRTAARFAPAGVATVLYDRIADLPAFSPDADDGAPHPAVADLRAALAAADAVLFCSPEYAGTLPGSFKNLFDWTVGTSDLHGKPVAWINAAAPNRGGGAVATLGVVLGYVGAEAIEAACVQLPVARESIGADGVIDDPDMARQLTKVLETIRDSVGGD